MMPSKGLLNNPGENNCFMNSAVQVCYNFLLYITYIVYVVSIIQWENQRMIALYCPFTATANYFIRGWKTLWNRQGLWFCDPGACAVGAFQKKIIVIFLTGSTLKESHSFLSLTKTILTNSLLVIFLKKNTGIRKEKNFKKVTLLSNTSMAHQKQKFLIMLKPQAK